MGGGVAAHTASGAGRPLAGAIPPYERERAAWGGNAKLGPCFPRPPGRARPACQQAELKDADISKRKAPLPGLAG